MKILFAAWPAPRPSWLTSAACAAAVFLLAAQAQLLAQCAMCRTAAAAQGAQAVSALNKAILILLFPAIALFSGVFLLAFRRPADRTPDNEPDETDVA